MKTNLKYTIVSRPLRSSDCPPHLPTLPYQMLDIKEEIDIVSDLLDEHSDAKDMTKEPFLDKTIPIFKHRRIARDVCQALEDLSNGTFEYNVLAFEILP